jgi:hypothetical protein
MTIINRQEAGCSWTVLSAACWQWPTCLPLALSTVVTNPLGSPPSARSRLTPVYRQQTAFLALYHTLTFDSRYDALPPPATAVPW